MRGTRGRARWVALGVVLLVQAALWAGCDQILGIEEASVMDATPPGDGAACPTFDAGAGEGGLIVELAAGMNFACALRADGTVWCWGSNQFGQLGHPPGTGNDLVCDVRALDANVACQPVPQRVCQLPAGIAHIAVGGDFACAATSAGGVLCWGLNNFDGLGHQAGVGDDECATFTATPQAACNPTPQAVQAYQNGPSFFADGGITTLTSGPTMTCALGGGNVYCWGAHESQALGMIYTADMPYPVVVPLEAGAAALAVSPSIDTSCTIFDGGQVSCWGTNTTQGIGSDSICADASCPPTTIVTEDGGRLGQAVEVRLGDMFACAVRADGSLWCWGTNGNDQLGNGPDAQSTQAAAPAVLWNPPGAQAAHIALSELATVVQDTQGRVWAWGSNEFGNVATGPNYLVATPDPDPYLITLGDGSAPATRIAAGYQSVLALTSDNKVWAWGVNTYGQLGHPEFSNGDMTCGGMSRECNNLPQIVPFPDE
jgi:alpha-tubulin suppressor-like RCC1 family protein